MEGCRDIGGVFYLMWAFVRENVMIRAASLLLGLLVTVIGSIAGVQAGKTNSKQPAGVETQERLVAN